MPLSVVGAKEVLGDVDAFMENKNRRYTTSCQCTSEAGEAYEIRQEDFLKEIKRLSNWKQIIDFIQAKKDKYLARIKMKQELQKIVAQNNGSKTEPEN